MSVFAALAVTTIQFRFVNHECPKVQLGSVIDDKNFRVQCGEVILAVRYAIQFDKDAGLTDNLSKFVALSTCPRAREILHETQFGGHHIKVKLEDTLVDTAITSRRAPIRAKSDRRIHQGKIIANTASRAAVETELKAHALMMAAIPNILHGTLRTFPSATRTSKMRAASVNCTGRWDTM